MQNYGLGNYQMYKIGDPVELTINKPFPGVIPGYETGKYSFVWNEGKTQKLARFRITEWDGNTVKGVVTNTYNHKRRGNN